MKRILCLWLPRWPIQRLIANRPELKHQILILYARKGSRGQRITACSCEASETGISIDMPLTEATALAGKATHSRANQNPTATPSIYTEQDNPDADRRELERLAERCEQFSPIVGLEPTNRTTGDPQEPSSLFLDVTGLGPLFGGEDSLTRKVATTLAHLGYTGRIAIADSIGAAWGLTHFSSFNPSPAGMSSSDGSIQIVPQGDMTEAIERLPLAALRLPDGTLSTLRQLGLEHIGQLLRIPRASLSARFGDIVLLRMDQALGRVREMIIAHHPPPLFQSSWIFEYPTPQREVVEFVVRQLIERVAHLLTEQNRGAVRIEMRIRCVAEESEDGTRRELVFCLGLFRPTACVRHLWDLIQLQLERATWPGPVEKIAIAPLLTAPLGVRQGELFEDSVRDGQRQLSQLIERLSSRLGSEAVLQPNLVSDAQPDRACRYVPLTGRRTRKSGKEVPLTLPFQAADRPLHLDHPAIPLQVVISINDGPPARFRDRRQWHTITRYWGPERIETGWWRGRSVRRDYYRVETEAGLWFWLYRQLDDGAWYLQGKFE